ncbi:NAD-dependent epimerase/dehydratase family protein [Microbacterium sp. NPDC089189]|uniref:NAD-dependent epimerase/dehydratase family protein n=1 Tax=Microbacterium sp. NPDC089189 TaxID=3154972 RepID=UPI00342DB3BC
MSMLVTGAAGFIGSTLVRRLLADGQVVIGIDSLTDYYDPSLKRSNLDALSHPAFTFLRADINSSNLPELLDGVDVVFHLAGQPGVRRSWGEEFQEYIDANIAATQKLLEAMRSLPRPPRLVYASSSSIYGDAESYPTGETASPRPRSPYGVTKLAAEHLCRLYAADFGLHTVSLRFFTVYGPGQRPDMAFTRFLRAAVEATPITLYGTGEQVRDFTYVDDIVDAVVRAGTLEVAAGSVYNVSGGGSHSVNEVLDVVRRLVDHDLVIDRQARAAGDVLRTGADISAITRDLGWRPRFDLESGLRAQLAWVRATSVAGPGV